MDKQDDHEQEFLKHLREEIIKTQDLRAEYVFRKLTFVISLLGLGSIQADRVDFTVILYIVPAIALAFDLYIVAGDYCVKRIGCFLKGNSVSKKEKKWQEYVNITRNPFTPLAMPLLTVTVIIICTFIILTREYNSIFLVLWFLLTFGASVKLYLRNKEFREQFENE